MYFLIINVTCRFWREIYERAYCVFTSSAVRWKLLPTKGRGYDIKFHPQIK